MDKIIFHIISALVWAKSLAQYTCTSSDVPHTIKKVDCVCNQFNEKFELPLNSNKFTKAEVITISQCENVTLHIDTFDTSNLQQLELSNINILILESPLPSSLRKLILQDIFVIPNIEEGLKNSDELFQLQIKNVTIENISENGFKWNDIYNVLLENVLFRNIKHSSLYLRKTKIDKTVHLKNTITIDKCIFNNISPNAINIASTSVIIKNSKFNTLSSQAMLIQAESMEITNNEFLFLNSNAIEINSISHAAHSSIKLSGNRFVQLEINAVSVNGNSWKYFEFTNNELPCHNKCSDKDIWIKSALKYTLLTHKNVDNKTLCDMLGSNVCLATTHDNVLQRHLCLNLECLVSQQTSTATWTQCGQILCNGSAKMHSKTFYIVLMIVLVSSVIFL